VNGLTLHVVEAGPPDGPLLVLLHGFPEFWWAWRHQIPPLAEAGYRVVVPDMRGYNLSEAPQDVSAYRLDMLAADVAALADACGAGRFRLVGHDWGGVIAWAVAARWAERLERLVIMNAPHPDVLSRQAFRHPTQALRSTYVALFQLPWLPEAALRAFDFAGLRRMMAGTARPGTFEPGAFDRYAAAWARPGSLTGMLNYYRALRERKTAAAARITPPTLVLWGARDSFLERHVADAGLDLCDDGRLSILESATHWLHLEEPERVGREILRFLGRADTVPGPEPSGGPDGTGR
jgi:epoxide hydrolase 4